MENMEISRLHVLSTVAASLSDQLCLEGSYTAAYVNDSSGLDSMEQQDTVNWTSNAPDTEMVTMHSAIMNIHTSICLCVII